MLHLLVLAALARAGSHSDSVGSTTSNTTLEDKWCAQFYTATVDATLTGLGFWGYEMVSGSTGTVTAYLWTRSGTGTWTATNLGNISVTSTTPARFRMTLATPRALLAGQTYGVGFSSDEAVWTQGYWSGSSSSTPDPVVWGTALGPDIGFVGASSRNLAAADVTYLTTKRGNYMDIVVDMPDGDGDGADMIDDCDDEDPSISPFATEIPYDGFDQDCDGLEDDSDADGDGHDADLVGGDDCDDTARSTYPGARDTWYDGVDSDCAGDDDHDQDRDGYAAPSGGGSDCDDRSAGVHTGAVDPWYDGVDTDCAGNDDYDQDRDGFRSRAYGGDDCDDLVGSVHPGASDRDYDGVDSDCAGDSDYDRDSDGHESAAYGGDDCDDEDAARWSDCPPPDTGGGDTADTAGSDTAGGDTGTLDTGGNDTGVGGETGLADSGDSAVADDTGRDEEREGPSPTRSKTGDTGGCANVPGGEVRLVGLLGAALALVGARGRRARR